MEEPAATLEAMRQALAALTARVARLESQFGADASLALAVNAPRGIVATITLPWRGAAAPSSTRR